MSTKAQHIVEGKIVDAETLEDLPFVSVTIEGTRRGTKTNSQGNFRLLYEKKINTLKVSFIGYTSATLKIDSGKNHIRGLVIKLPKNTLNLSEVVITPGENPAHRIIKEVLKHRDKNNPSLIKQYRCSTYTKAICDLSLAKNSNEQKSTSYKRAERISKMSIGDHFLISESVTERSYKAKDFVNEKVVGTKLSGIKDPSFSIIPSTTQPFGFYNDFIKIFNKQYINPISEGSTKKYFFNIEDTLYHEQDTIFVISFRPSKNTNFLGFSGNMHINTNGFALQRIKLSPADEGGVSSIFFVQEYAPLTSGQWFPTSLYSEIKYPNFPSKHLTTLVTTLSTISNVTFSPTFNSESFGHVQVALSPNATHQDEAFWAQHRSAPLTASEQKTYQKMDSIGKARHYDQKLKIAQSLLSYRYPISWYDIDVNRIVDFNRVEGLRLGIGAHTNDSLMKWASIGGYAALGTRDQEFKFGGDIAFNIYPKKDVKLIYAYSNDVEPPANTQNMYPKAPWLQNMSRNRMDKSDRHDISFESRLFKYFTSALTYRHEVREPFYNRPEHNLSSYPSFSITELRLKARFAYKERIIESFGRKFSKGTNYPILNFGITKGLSQWGGSYDYTRLQAGIEKRFLGIVTGETKVLLEGGLAFGDVPYFALFDGNGTLMPAQLLWIRNTFQTMRPYEFLSDKYVSIFVQQRLKPILKRFHSEYFAPEPTLYFNYGIGNLNKSQPDQTLIPDFKIMSKGFSEAGCIINNVLRFEYMGLTYLGVGMGAFMRTGYYQEKRIGNNIVYKISFTLSFN